MKYRGVILLITLLIAVIDVSATAYETAQSGDWTESSTWVGGIVPNGIHNSTITIKSNHEITLDGTVDVSHHVTLELEAFAKLTVGYILLNDEVDLEVDHHLTIIVHDDANLIINHDVHIGKKANITLEGDMVVQGDLTMEKDAVIDIGPDATDGSLIVEGDLTLDPATTITGNGDIYVGGEATVPSQYENDIIPIDPQPIELVSFAITMQGSEIRANWVTATEKNNDFFTIEYSSDGYNFTPIKEIDGAGNSSQTLEYTTTVAPKNSGLGYYRLKQTDFDGQYSYSNIESINYQPQQSLSAYPNPFNDKLNISLSNNAEDATLSVLSLTGQVIQQTKASSINQSIDLSHLPNGSYIISLSSQGQQVNQLVQKF